MKYIPFLLFIHVVCQVSNILTPVVFQATQNKAILPTFENVP